MHSDTPIHVSGESYIKNDSTFVNLDRVRLLAVGLELLKYGVPALLLDRRFECHQYVLTIRVSERQLVAEFGRKERHRGSGWDGDGAVVELEAWEGYDRGHLVPKQAAMAQLELPF